MHTLTTFVHGSKSVLVSFWPCLYYAPCVCEPLCMCTPNVGLLFWCLGPKTITQSSRPYNNRGTTNYVALVTYNQFMNTQHSRLIYISHAYKQFIVKNLLRHTNNGHLSLVFGLICNWRFPFNCMTGSFFTWREKELIFDKQTVAVQILCVLTIYYSET